MKALLALTVACLSLQGVAAADARPPQHARHRAAITAVLKNYETALNANDVEGIARLYTDDAVVLAPNAPSAVGIGAVRTAYTRIFQAIDLDLTFKVAELNIVSPSWAFLRSTSSGVVTILANGAQIPSSNQELFVLHKTHGRWKLARYSFSSTLPPA